LHEDISKNQVNNFNFQLISRALTASTHIHVHVYIYTQARLKLGLIAITICHIWECKFDR